MTEFLRCAKGKQLWLLRRKRRADPVENRPRQHASRRIETGRTSRRPQKGSLSEATIERALKAERELVNANETGKSSPRNISKISRSFTHKRLFSRTGVRANLRHQ
jgi:hypothetical protein